VTASGARALKRLESSKFVLFSNVRSCSYTHYASESAPAPVGGGAGGLPLNKITPPPPPSQRAGLIKIVATRCQILRLKCTKSFVGWGSAPDPAGGAYSAPPDPLARF